MATRLVDIFWLAVLFACVLLCARSVGSSKAAEHNLAALERSFWRHASLASVAQRGYWGPTFPASSAPTEQDIRNGAKLLTGRYAANRLYLVYHQEIPIEEAEQVFRWWRQHRPKQIQLVPTLVLRMYDKQQTPVFKPEELRRLVEFFKRSPLS